MKVTLAKSAGFCFGVKRAVDMVYEQIEDAKERPIYTYGPIIHNEEVVKELAEKGVRVIAEDEDLHGLEPGDSHHPVSRRGTQGQGRLGKCRLYHCRCHLSLCAKDPQICGKICRRRLFRPDRRKREPPGSTGDHRLDAKRFLCRYFYAAGS